uniref:(northern house mosquito) hypothetical protein n=1 Tax=Culex pipiens TaxID=7175 RepID=A0A8D8BXC9_CULPI
MNNHLHTRTSLGTIRGHLELFISSKFPKLTYLSRKSPPNPQELEPELAREAAKIDVGQSTGVASDSSSNSSSSSSSSSSDESDSDSNTDSGQESLSARKTKKRRKTGMMA